jgi:AraC-like DNA-binding protein
MKDTPYSLRFQWMLESEDPAFAYRAKDGDIEAKSLHFPPELGEGCFRVFGLALGMTLIQSEHRMTPAAVGHFVPVGQTDIDYGAPAFVVHSVRGGRICQQERLPEAKLMFEEGRDFFLHTQQRRTLPLVDGATDSTMVALVMQVTLLQALNLTTLPSLAVHAMPKQVSAPLHLAMAKRLTGPTQKLFAQAKVLEYLSGLEAHLRVRTPREVLSPQVKARVKACRDFLLEQDGKLPTLESLAGTFNLPARRLNAEFKEAYGQTIFAFITGHRLDQARQALLETELPLKEIAHKLGYSHVNNFTAAFIHRFSEPPGKVRAQARKQTKSRSA